MIKSEFYNEVVDKTSTSNRKNAFVCIQLQNHLNYINNQLSILSEDGINHYSESFGSLLFQGVSGKIDITEDMEANICRYYKEEGFNISTTIKEATGLEISISWTKEWRPLIK